MHAIGGMASAGRAPWRLQYRHAIGERSHAIPAQLHVVVEAAANDVHVAADQPGDDAAAGPIDPIARNTRQRQHILVAANGENAFPADRDGLGFRMRAIVRGDATAGQNRIGRRGHRALLSGCLELGCDLRHVASLEARPGELVLRRQPRAIAVGDRRCAVG